MKVGIKKLNDKATIPTYARSGDAGMDIIAIADEVIAPGERKLIPSGFSVEVPEGYEIQIRPKSGLALKQGISIVNSPATIDAGYRGELGIILINTDKEKPYHISVGDKIAQIVLNKFELIEFEERDSLSPSERGERGFGSTGIK